MTSKARIAELEKELARENALVSLDSYSQASDRKGWHFMEWNYLRRQHPGPEETVHLRKCYEYARATGLIEVRGREFRFKVER